MRTLEDHVAGSAADRRRRVLPAARFAAFALAVAMVGLFGALADRRHELAIRAAVGAPLVRRSALVVTGAGLVAGLFAAVATGRGLASLLYGACPTTRPRSPRRPQPSSLPRWSLPRFPPVGPLRLDPSMIHLRAD